MQFSWPDSGRNRVDVRLTADGLYRQPCHGTIQLIPLEKCTLSSRLYERDQSSPLPVGQGSRGYSKVLRSRVAAHIFSYQHNQLRVKQKKHLPPSPRMAAVLLLLLVLCCAYVEPVRCSSHLLADTTLQRREHTILRPYVKRGHVVIFEFRKPSACRYAYHVNAPPPPLCSGA